MGIRVAAVLAAAVIAIAVGAAILAAHNGPSGSVPAGTDSNTKAYQAMIKADYDALVTSGSDALATSDSQKWLSDLKSFQTPARFAVLDGMLRRHLTDYINYLNAQKSGNAKDLNFAGEGAFYENEWIDPTAGVIAGTYPRVAGSYDDALALAKQSLEACINQAPGPADIGCEHLYHPDVCANVGLQACADDAHTYGARIQIFLIGLLQNPAPAKLAAKDRQIQTALALVDADTIAVTDGLLSGDSAKTLAAEAAFVTDITLADNYIGVVGSA